MALREAGDLAHKVWGEHEGATSDPGAPGVTR